MTERRIWELDALRGICILGMAAVHLLYDLSGLGISIAPRLLTFFQNWGGIVFLLLSGICVTLGRRHIRRGLLVFGCGMLCTAVTVLLYHLGFAPGSIVISFGVLHCLGSCMLLWQLFRHCSNPLLAILSISFCILGLMFQQQLVPYRWGIPFGLMYPGFTSADYFPLFPNLGYFLLGALLGRRLYPRKTTRFPIANPSAFPIRFLCQCGTHSLWIYLLHQPLFAGMIALVSVFVRSHAL